jgi:hypothetical protein
MNKEWDNHERGFQRSKCIINFNPSRKRLILSNQMVKRAIIEEYWALKR